MCHTHDSNHHRWGCRRVHGDCQIVKSVMSRRRQHDVSLQGSTHAAHLPQLTSHCYVQVGQLSWS